MYYKHSNYKKVIKVYIGEIEKCQNNHFQPINKVKKLIFSLKNIFKSKFVGRHFFITHY